MRFLNFRFYLKSPLSPGVVSLYSSRSIMQIASGFLGLFLPVFLLQKYGFRLELVLLFYLASYALYLFLIIPGAMMMSQVGIKRSLLLSVPFACLYYLCFYYFDSNILVLSLLAIITISLWRMFFWIPFHTDFARFTDRKNRGKQISFLVSITTLISIFIPVISGYILFHFNFEVLFILAIILFLVSAIPLLLVPATYEKFSWRYFETWRRLFSSRQRKLLLAYMADGGEWSIGVMVWPIFIWQLLEGNYFSVGIVSSLIILATVLLRLIMGGYTDKFDKKKIMRVGTLLDALGWVFKVFITTGFQIFIAATYHNFASIIMRTPLETLMYEKAADSGHYVDEYTVLREMASTIGKTMMTFLILVLVGFVSINLVFILAALASLVINLLPPVGLPVPQAKSAVV